jgi:hypothetical protein
MKLNKKGNTMEFKDPKLLYNAIKKGIKVGYYNAHISTHATNLDPDRDTIENSIMVEILRCIDEIL